MSLLIPCSAAFTRHLNAFSLSLGISVPSSQYLAIVLIIYKFPFSAIFSCQNIIFLQSLCTTSLPSYILIKSYIATSCPFSAAFSYHSIDFSYHSSLAFLYHSFTFSRNSIPFLQAPITSRLLPSFSKNAIKLRITSGLFCSPTILRRFPSLSYNFIASS